MDLRESQYVDNLVKRLDSESLISPEDIARLLPLYIKTLNDNGIVRNVSMAYISTYDGKSIYRRYGRFFNQMYEMFLRNGMDENDRRRVFKGVARRVKKVPTTMKGMQFLLRVVIEESHACIKRKKVLETRESLVTRFRNAVKKYLHLTYSLGFNVPSQCVKTLASTHRLDKYVMSGDFPVLLLPFMPDIEKAIRDSYEHYEMKDAWEVLNGRYFSCRSDYANLALEIKTAFTRTIPNFTEYFDNMYTNTYYSMMLGKNRKGENGQHGK